MDLSHKKLFIISAPSGSGKTTIYKIAEKALNNLSLSVSYTTRQPRPGEVNGVDYFFVNEDVFKEMIEQDRFIEWAVVHGNYYGTSKDYISAIQEQGKIPLLDIDVQGALQIKRLDYPNTVFIFILPPSLEILRERLIKRGTENEEDLLVRLENARTEIKYKDQYDYVIINDALEAAVKDFIRAILVESVDPGTVSTTAIEGFLESIKVA